jgi:hypothetical protein
MAHAEVLRALELKWTSYVDEAANYGPSSHVDIQGSMSIDSNESQSLLQDVKNKMMDRALTHRQVGTNREFWVDKQASISQWTRPYRPHVFRSQDIEIETFVQILIQKDIFAKRSVHLTNLQLLLE